MESRNHRITKDELALRRIVQKLSTGQLVPDLPENLRCLSTSTLGKLILFFRNQPEEYMTYQDLLVKYDGEAVSASLFTNLRRGISSAVLSANIVEDELRIYGGPNLENLKVSTPDNSRNILGGERLKRSSLMYSTLVRLKEDPSLEIETRNTGIPENRYTTVFRFAIDHDLVCLHLRDDGVRVMKAGPSLQSASYIKSDSDILLQILASMDSRSKNSVKTNGAKLSLSTVEFCVLQDFLRQSLTRKIPQSKLEDT
jgi:hypothetical protein